MEDLILCFIDIRVRMSINIHFLSAHLDYLSDNFVDYSEEQGKWFIHILIIEDRYQGNVTIDILYDYCWSQKGI